MAEYIDREALINAMNSLCNMVCDYSPAQRHFMCGCCPLGSALELVEDFPTTEVSPVVHGKWLKDYKMPTCSICGNAVPFPDQYCSNCGSKMDLDIADYVAERGRENG